MPPSLVTSIFERAHGAALEGLARRAEEADDISTLQRVFENLPDDLIWWLALAALNCLVFVPPIIFVSAPHHLPISRFPCTYLLGSFSQPASQPPSIDDTVISC